MTTQAVKRTRQPWSTRPAIRLLVASQDFLASREVIGAYRDVIESDRTDTAVAPPLFPIVAAGKACRRAVETLLARNNAAVPDGLPTQRVIQVDHDMTIERPVRAGDALHAAVAISSTRVTPLGSRAELGVSVHDASGALVASFVNGVLLRCSVPRQRALQAVGGSEPRLLVADECSTRLSIGCSRSYEYAMVTGDDNPIHFDHHRALSAGLPSVVASGMCALGMILDRAVSTLLSNDECAVRRVSCRFSRPVRVGEELGVVLRPIVDEVDHDSRGFVSLRGVVADGVALKGTVEVQQA